ncbi:glutamate 5-kinase [Litorimonas taeanensis]|uniref:Glutamate 5-kinase n=2 Tax=Litorimonas taeanensis TaxID=568099 RepID=A0A420WJB8_9PROT|nr:glutamate 5-kinase [Litorimonas taeanensis]RKQ71026.1 glutamate 5-kinase [Litorimonas taeanensis]
MSMGPKSSLSGLGKYQRLVIKIGSALLVESDSLTLRQSWLNSICDDIAERHKLGLETLIVSSGAIALGRARLNLIGRILDLSEKQACAAAGQALLTQAYDKALSAKGLISAQALLTLNDTEDRRKWLNARSTLETLLALEAIPIINENDTVATDEIRYGDNDRLAARTAQMVGADALLLLSDIDGLYTADPRFYSDAKHLPVIENLTPQIIAMGGPANTDAAVGTGGMETKLAAAQIAVQAGCEMIILNGTDNHPLSRFDNGERHSLFIATQSPRKARAQWISGSLKPKGQIEIDSGAHSALKKGRSLLAAGIVSIEGQFDKGDAICIIDQNKQEIARGLVNYGSKDANRIMGLHSDNIEMLLGYTNGDAIVHRDNLVMRD